MPEIEPDSTTMDRKRISARAARAKPRKKRIGKGRTTGVPAPLKFDIYQLPPTTLLSAIDAAAFLRLTPQTMRAWHHDGHPIVKFHRVGDRLMTTVGDLINYAKANKVKR